MRGLRKDERGYATGCETIVLQATACIVLVRWPEILVRYNTLYHGAGRLSRKRSKAIMFYCIKAHQNAYKYVKTLTEVAEGCLMAAEVLTTRLPILVAQ